MSYDALGEDDYNKLVEELTTLIEGVFARKDIFSPPVVESANNDNDANRRYIDFFENDDDCDQSEHTPVDYLAQSGEQELEFSIGWPNTERGLSNNLIYS
ncbi:hypothetical protein SeLEV6574_g04863 [Synchytrium endobioticum]|uniref:Uncharacterized protein n=1 Tax=Synchytrium endobioticum TaxID=286115 RepID=A0A507CX38_9FUNG|nr:hypothetical protein SeLEV6574_g04863 [Synchytrium endobioticum]